MLDITAGVQNGLEKRGYSVKEVSKITTLSQAYLRNDIREGRLVATRFGRRIVILTRDLEDYLNKGAQ